MIICPIFEEESTCSLWSVCYDEDIETTIDPHTQKEKSTYRMIFDIIFENWDNQEYVDRFLNENFSDLTSPFWNGLKLDDAFQKIDNERILLEKELNNCDVNNQSESIITAKEIFKNLHNSLTSLKWNEEDFRKGKVSSPNPMLRIYAIELEDGTFVITGGAIKLKKKMEGEIFDKEFQNLRKVKQFLKENGITDRMGLIDHYNTIN